MNTPESYNAVVRPMGKPWGDNPTTLSFEISPPIQIVDPNIGDIIAKNLEEARGRAVVTPVIGNTDDESTKGFLLNGYRPSTGGEARGYFGTSNRKTEEESVTSALGQLVGGVKVIVEFVELPVKV